jgi:DNA-binding response OmpR family regulator
MRVLLVEDEKKLASLIKKALESAKFSVDAVHDGQEALDFATTYSYDLIILDILLPRKNGFEIIGELRKKRVQSPVLMLTAKDSLEDKILGLDLGADDYLTKPFDFGELLARLRALLRREIREKPVVLELGDLRLDPKTHRVTRGMRDIRLTLREYSLLEFFMRRKNQVLSRETIIEHVWDSSFEGMPNIVDVYINYLRKKIDAGFSSKLIHTIRGAGYVLRAEDES